MENNDYNQQELISQDTIIEEPWAHQFEQDDAQSTRVSRHQSSGSSLYTKIMFTVFFLIILAVGVWAVLKGTNILGGTSQQGSTTPAVPKLVLQSQTTQSTTAAQTNAATVTTTTRAVETTQATNTPPATQNNTAYQEGTYTIVAGDSASRIAAAHDMTIAEFYALNGFTEQTVLLPGNTVRVSGGSGGTTTTNTGNTNATTTNTSAGEYVIKSGDSIYSIAEAHGMSMSEFKQLNGFTDDSLLLPGQVVKVTR